MLPLRQEEQRVHIPPHHDKLQPLPVPTSRTRSRRRRRHRTVHLVLHDHDHDDHDADHTAHDHHCGGPVVVFVRGRALAVVVGAGDACCCGGGGGRPCCFLVRGAEDVAFYSEASAASSGTALPSLPNVFRYNRPSHASRVHPGEYHKPSATSSSSSPSSSSTAYTIYDTNPRHPPPLLRATTLLHDGNDTS